LGTKACRVDLFAERLLRIERLPEWLIIYVRFFCEKNGRLEDLEDDMTLPELGGICPLPGDMIKRGAGIFYDVKARYFGLRVDGIGLVVYPRNERAEELSLP
jgi:hypothetical protein